MILDTFKNIKLYSGLGNRFSQAIDFLCETDFSNFKPGKIFIDGKNIFAMLNEYQTKNVSDCKLEAHKKYIDIQYIISGEELIGFATLKNQKILEEYDDEKDVVFFDDDVEVDLLKLKAGMFTVFFPDDLHKPCVKVNELADKVQKIVVKIKI